MNPKEALCYLDDIAHGRKMNLDAHELKLFIEKSLDSIEIIKEYVLRDLFFDDENQGINFSFGAFTLCKIIKDKEKYDLLKEVFL